VKNRQHEKESRAGGNRRQGAVYQGAFEAVIALLIAIVFGYWLDGVFDTAPVLLLVGTAIGFASFTVRLIRLGRWMKSADSDGSSELPSRTTRSNDEH
jgi:F0F1-type ATP synthase assembly protein I